MKCLNENGVAKLRNAKFTERQIERVDRRIAEWGERCESNPKQAVYWRIWGVWFDDRKMHMSGSWLDVHFTPEDRSMISFDWNCAKRHGRKHARLDRKDFSYR